MDRRDFLHPRQFVYSAGTWIGAMDCLESLAVAEAPAEEYALLRFSRRAMATTFEVLLPFGSPDGVTVAESALDEIDRLEAQLTVYRDDSDISRLNRSAHAEPVEVEDNLFGLLLRAAGLSRETDGAFDITAGPLIKAWGIFHRRHRLPAARERAEILERVGMTQVRLDATKQTVRYDTPGMEINLGSIGKGYALDRVTHLVRNRWKVSSALLHGGHSSVYAIGSAPGD